jgi:hypothetical protein
MCHLNQSQVYDLLQRLYTKEPRVSRSKRGMYRINSMILRLQEMLHHD